MESELKLTGSNKKKDAYLRRKYNITYAQYAWMLKAQSGKCALCGRPPKRLALNVDHCHKTLRVRGLLCFLCNKYLIGRWRAEHAALLQRAATYLRSNFDGRKVKVA